MDRKQDGVYLVINMGQLLQTRKNDSKDGTKSSEENVKKHREKFLE